MKMYKKISIALAALWAVLALVILIWMGRVAPAQLPTPALNIFATAFIGLTPVVVVAQVFLNFLNWKSGKR